MKYEQFKEFHDKHPNLDNMEYYAEFPETNKSTIRSWKSKAGKTIIEEEIPEPSKKQIDESKGYEELVIESLCSLTKTSKESLRGMNVKAQIQYLKNKRDDLENQEPETVDRTSNGPILPIPKPIGINATKFGLDEYIEFDGVKNEIRMEIPMTVLFDPIKNEALGKIIK